MSKIERHIEKKAIEYRSDYDPSQSYYQYSYVAVELAFINGSKELDKLELSIKFLNWCADNGWYRNGRCDEWYQLQRQQENKTAAELYKYWLENIFKL